MTSIADKLGMGPTREVIKNDDGSWTVKVTPPDYVGQLPTVSVHLTAEQHDGYRAWREGALIQKALPDLSVKDRELLIHGLDLDAEDADWIRPEWLGKEL